MAEGFFERWSRRKQQVREADAVALPEAPEPAILQPEVQPLAPEPIADGTPPPPSLADAEALTIDSDYKPFMARNVAPEVKNAAFKKLFADPHFNVMDGLDTYIDDYSVPSPLPQSVLRQMASAKFLNLFDDEPVPAAESTEHPEKPSLAANEVGMAQSSSTPIPLDDPAASSNTHEAVNSPSPQVAIVPPASQVFDDHDPDLRLQPDDAARAPHARDGAG